MVARSVANRASLWQSRPVPTRPQSATAPAPTLGAAVTPMAFARTIVAAYRRAGRDPAPALQAAQIAPSQLELIDGRMTAGPAGASGTVTAKATGLEQAIAALRDPKAGDGGKQAADQLTLALSLAEQKDGAAVWRIDFEGDRVSINGREVSPGTKKAAPEPAPTPAPTPATPSTGKQGSTKAPTYKAGENPLGGSDADSIKRMFDEKSAKGGAKSSTKSSVKKALDADEEE